MKQSGSGKQSGSNKDKPSGSNKKVANGLVAVSCAAVLAVYTAGYVRTRSAAEGFEAQAAERRTAVPDAPRTESAIAESQPVVLSAIAESVPSKPARDAAPSPSPIAAAVIVPAEPAPTQELTPVATTANVAKVDSAPAPVETPIATVAAPVTAPAPVAPPVVAAVAEPVVASFTAPVAVPVVAPPAAPVAIQAAAPAPPAVEHKVAAIAAAPVAPKWKDGTYFGWGTSRHGDIQAQVIIESGRISSATISQCRTRYPCSVIEKLPPEVAQRQSPDVDYVSRATQSANAFYYAVVEALGKAK